MTQVSAAFHDFSLRSHTVRLLASRQPSSLLISAYTRADMHSTGPESPQESDSEASDHGASGEAEQMQEHAAPKEPALEREDWMSKAMPKSIPGAASETADKAKEEPAKKVTLLSRKAFYISLAQKSQSLQERVHRAQHCSCLAQRICDLDVTICGVSRVCSPVLMWCFADELCGVRQPQHTAVQIFPLSSVGAEQRQRDLTWQGSEAAFCDLYNAGGARLPRLIVCLPGNPRRLLACRRRS